MYLPHKEAGHHRVEAACRHIEHIPALYSVPSEERCDITSGGERLCDLCRRDAWVAPEENLGAWCRFENHPRFVFADGVWAVPRTCQLIIRVHLNGEAPLHVEKFDEHAIAPLVCLPEPRLADGAAWRAIRSKCTESLSAPYARDQTRSE
ncbi:MAG: hypothetical protein ACKOFX_07800 [Solirubrobacterales bacterium]